MDLEKTMESILEQLAHTASHPGTVAVRVEEIAALQARTDKRLDRAVGLAVREARQERKKRSEMDERADKKITPLASAEPVTEEKLPRLIDSQGGSTGKG
jgi:hypothetical protein